MHPTLLLPAVCGLMLAAMPVLAAPAFLVIAHRGASGERPEHTLEAYRLAIAQGADVIEPDLVPTRDGVLVARHENALAGSTDVADRPEFAARKARKRVDGVWIEDWFAEDFTLAELRTLRARETRPAERPASAAFDGRFGIATFAEVLALAKAESERLGRPIGVYPETKHPTFFLHEGRHLDGTPIALDTSAMLVDALVAAGFADPARVFIQSFEIDNLRRLRRELLPRAGIEATLVFLVGDTSGRSDPATTNVGQPYDVVWHAMRGDDLEARYGALAGVVPGFGARTTYGDLVTPAALAALRPEVDALGPWIASLLQAAPAPPAAADPRPRLGPGPAPWLAEARRLGFAVHAYTLRAEPAYRFLDAEGREQSPEAQLRDLVSAGVTGVFADQPALAVAVRDAMAREADASR
ncbi:MAG: glycerophosphodiester phosphodiesterase family protein [Lysobacteraceae bacterium]